jgi:hypothetical protein
VNVTYGQIAGTALDSATKAPIAGICVHAYYSTGGVLASSQTNSSGAYTLSSVPAGSTQVGFSSGCGASNYLTQYYDGQPSLTSASTITVPAGGTASGIDAAMLAGGQITGTVTAIATNTTLAGICVQAYDGGGAVVASTQTNSSGVYTLSALPTGSYQVGFADCNAGPDFAGTYVTQYYNGKATLASADPVAVTAGRTTSGISAAMVTHGQITGTVTDSATGAPLAGICLDIFDSGGGISQTSTNASGVYTTIHLMPGSYRVGFNLGCSDSAYATQYYNDQPTLAGADPVTVSDGTTTSGINAALVASSSGSTPAPTVGTDSATGLGTVSATVSGTVNPTARRLPTTSTTARPPPTGPRHPPLPIPAPDRARQRRPSRPP